MASKDENPSTMTEENPSTMTEENPSTMTEENPYTMTEENPYTMTEENPYTMTEEILQKRYGRVSRGRFITQFYVAVIAFIASFSFGNLMGWARLNYKSTEHLNRTSVGDPWTVSFTPLGCALGFTPSYYMINSYGPKKTMIIFTPFYVLSFLSILRTELKERFVMIRLTSGLMAVIYLTSSERLLIETVHQRNLTHMLIFLRIFLLLGLLFSYVYGHLHSYYSSTLFCAGGPILNVILMFIIPESPVFLYKKNEVKAVKSLLWYRGRNDFYSAFHCLQSEAEIYKSASESDKYMIFYKCVAKGVLLIIIINFFKAVCGYYIFILYSLHEHEPKITVFDEFTDMTIFLTSLIVINTIVRYTRLSANYSVKKALVLGSAIVTIMLILETTFLFMLYTEFLSVQLSKTYYIQILIWWGFILGFTVGYENNPDKLLHDYLPQQIRHSAVHITHACYWFFVFCLMLGFSLMIPYIPYCIGFLTLSVISFVGTIFCQSRIIDSKDKSLVQIQLELGGNPIGNRGSYRTRRASIVLEDII